METERKINLRKQMKSLLKALDRNEKAVLDRKVGGQLLELPEISGASCIYGYMSLSWETGTGEILEQFLNRGIRLALPKVIGREMDFFEVSSLDDLEEGTFHIMEPKTGCKKADWPDAVLMVPGLAFSKDGKRLGKGGGYYDKYLERYPHLRTVALAYDFQITDEIPIMEHDRRVDMVVTESCRFICGK